MSFDDAVKIDNHPCYGSVIFFNADGILNRMFILFIPDMQMLQRLILYRYLVIISVDCKQDPFCVGKLGLPAIFVSRKLSMFLVIEVFNSIR